MRLVNSLMIDDPVDSHQCGDVGGIFFAHHPERRRYDDFNGRPVLAGRKQQPSGTLPVIGRERRPFQQLGGPVAAVVGVDVERELLAELGRRVGHDLRQFLPGLDQPGLGVPAVA